MNDYKGHRPIHFAYTSTVKSRYNGFQGTERNHPLLPKSVIAKTTIVESGNDYGSLVMTMVDF